MNSPPGGGVSNGGDSPHGSLCSQTNDSPPPASMGEQFSRNSTTRSTAGPRMMLNRLVVLGYLKLDCRETKYEEAPSLEIERIFKQ